jgi:predicted dinucleotide-binding enzyme
MSERPVWPPKNLSAALSVQNQAPLTSYTAAFELTNMVHLTPSATTDRAGTVVAGDRAPQFRAVGTRGDVVTLDTFTGKPLVLRLTRAVAERFV